MATETGASRPIVEQLAAFDSATLHEAAGREGAVHPAIKPLSAATPIAGRALTARCHPGGNLAIHRAVAAAQPGDMLVVAAGGDVRGYWGEVLTAAAQARGVRALIIDGGVRDSAALKQRCFPVWPRGVGDRGCVKVRVDTGDFVVADDDGVVVVPRERVAEVLEAAGRRVEGEAKLIERLEAGELTLDLLGLRDILYRNGIA